MKLAISGSRGLSVDLNEYIESLGLTISEIITGGAKGIDKCAEEYAIQHDIKLTIIRPDYKNYPYRAAPIIRNKEIVSKCDVLLAIWDGNSKGTKATIDFARKQNKTVIIFMVR